MFVTWLAQRVDNHGKKQCITCVGLPCKHHTFGPMLWVMRSYSMWVIGGKPGVILILHKY